LPSLGGTLLRRARLENLVGAIHESGLVPEGDNIYKHAAAFRARLVGSVVRALYRGGVAEPRFAGLVLQSADAHGKHLTLAFAAAGGSPTLTARVHLGIAGTWRIGAATRYGALQKSSSPLCLDFGEIVAFVRKPKDIVLASAGLADRRALAALGPDLLADPDFDEIMRRARAPERAARPLGELLLDQRVAAGIGNVYKSELCFEARLHPFLRVDEVDDAQLRHLFARAAEQLAANLGSWRRTTTADRSRGEAPPAGVGRTWVYGRKGRGCHVCGTPIERRVMGPDLRGTFYCPRCQAP
jgi:endonuclease-8